MRAAVEFLASLAHRSAGFGAAAAGFGTPLHLPVLIRVRLAWFGTRFANLSAVGADVGLMWRAPDHEGECQKPGTTCLLACFGLIGLADA